MASNFIKYSQANNTGKLVAQAVNSTMEALAAMRRAQAILDRFANGAPPDFSVLAGELGISLQEANDVWSIFATAHERLDHDAVRVELARLDQG